MQSPIPALQWGTSSDLTTNIPRVIWKWFVWQDWQHLDESQQLPLWISFNSVSKEALGLAPVSINQARTDSSTNTRPSIPLIGHWASPTLLSHVLGKGGRAGYMDTSAVLCHLLQAAGNTPRPVLTTRKFAGLKTLCPRKYISTAVLCCLTVTTLYRFSPVAHPTQPAPAHTAGIKAAVCLWEAALIN